jgi:hypothetical protein
VRQIHDGNGVLVRQIRNISHVCLAFKEPLKRFSNFDVVFDLPSIDLFSSYHPNLGQELEEFELRRERRIGKVTSRMHLWSSDAL